MVELKSSGSWRRQPTSSPGGRLRLYLCLLLLPSPRHEGADCKLVKGDGSLESADPCLLTDSWGWWAVDERLSVLGIHITILTNLYAIFILFTKDVSNFQHDSNRSWKFKIVDIQSFSSIFLNRDYDSSIREQKLSKMHARIRAQSHFIPAILLFGRRETVSRGRVSRSLFNLLACGIGREGGRPRNARKEGSVLLHRGERGGAREERLLSTSPKGNYWQSAKEMTS